MRNVLTFVWIFIAVATAPVGIAWWASRNRQHDTEVHSYGDEHARVGCLCGWTRVFVGSDALVEAEEAGRKHMEEVRRDG